MEKYKRREDGKVFEVIKFAEAKWEANANEIEKWVNSSSDPNPAASVRYDGGEMCSVTIEIQGWECRYLAEKGDWVVKDFKGEFSVVMGEVFDKLFSEIEEEP